MDAKKLVLLLLVVFIGFWMFTDPNGLATTATSSAESAWGLLAQLFRALISFFSAL
jgi:hypothetical protein